MVVYYHWAGNRPEAVGSSSVRVPVTRLATAALQFSGGGDAQYAAGDSRATLSPATSRPALRRRK